LPRLPFNDARGLIRFRRTGSAATTR